MKIHRIQQNMETKIKKKEDLTGRVFHKLTVLGFSHQGPDSKWHYRYRCECGREGTVQKSNLRKQRACGKCKRHGGSHTPEYEVWHSMKARCLNPNAKAFSRYGGRGIKVCDEWMKFDAFMRDMGERPGPGYQIDRINNNGNYEKGNCRWVTGSANRSNRRDSHFWHIKGQVFSSAAEAARHLGVASSAIGQWVHGFKNTDKHGTVRAYQPRKDCFIVPKYENIS